MLVGASTESAAIEKVIIIMKNFFVSKSFIDTLHNIRLILEVTFIYNIKISFQNI